jgi:DNA polymerase-3 subunit gamma/tau
LIVVLAVGNNAGSVLRGVANDEIEKLTTQAFAFGMSSLTHASEVVSETLNSMSGATSPKLQLELMCARVLVPASSDSEAGSLARLDRLERRIGVSGTSEQASSPVAASQPAASKPAAAPAKSAPATSAPAASAPTEAIVVEGLTELTTQSFKDSWAEILSLVNKESKAAWMVAFALQVIDFDSSTTVLTLKFPNERDLETFKTSGNSTDVLRRAINSVLGVTVKFKPQFGPPATAPIAVVAEAPASESSNQVATPEPASTDVEDDAVALLEEEAAAVESVPAPVAEKPKAKSRNSKLVDEESRYGESLLREMLGAEPVDDKKNGR